MRGVGKRFICDRVLCPVQVVLNRGRTQNSQEELCEGVFENTKRISNSKEPFASQYSQMLLILQFFPVSLRPDLEWKLCCHSGTMSEKGFIALDLKRVTP